ncbi:hypothetical protein [Parasutterella muris]|uniref:hypothetical protein n=1 Tax=Parasutterella muris TaxID=2565572 RepID=UPI0019249A37|nr:hypothetical protein [Parasutterella muris]
MASNTKNVKLGVCRVYFGDKEEDLGYTKGGVDVSIATETHEVTVDQLGNTPINEYITARTAEVTVPLAETTLENAVKIMPGAQLLTDAEDTTKRYVDVPTGTGLSLMDYAQRLRLHPIANADDNREDDLIIYRAATPGQMDYSYNLDEERIFSCTFKAYPDEEGKLFAMGDVTAMASGQTPPDEGSENFNPAATYTTPVNNVFAAILHDASETVADENLCTDYAVSAKSDGGKQVKVEITANDLVNHENGQNRLGHWVGFALVAPDGVDGFKYAKGAKATLGGVNALEDNVYNGEQGFTMYVDHTENGMADVVIQLQWTKGGEDEGDLTYYVIDTSKVVNA